VAGGVDRSAKELFMKFQLLLVSVGLSCLTACGDDTGSGAAAGASSGGAGQGGQAQGGQAQGGQAQGGEPPGGNSANGGNGSGGEAACVPSGSGSAADVDCGAYCEAVVAADCDNGPPTVAACSAICEQLKSECPGYDNLADCAGANLELACDANGMVATVGCEDVFAACVVPCLGG
jgi:hypothetical protein